MNRILVVAALIMVLTGCGDTSLFENQRYQIVKGSEKDYLLDTRTGRTWEYGDSRYNLESKSRGWRTVIDIDEKDRVEGLPYTPEEGVPYTLHSDGRITPMDLDLLNEMPDAE